MKRRYAWCAPGRFILALMSCWFIIACGPDSDELNSLTPDSSHIDIGSCGLGLPPTTTDQEAIAAILNAESSFVVGQDIDALMRLWTTSGRISDANHTPDNLEDDQTWQGVDAIRHRYVRWVFPGAPATAKPADLIITIEGDRAVVTGTTRIGDEISPAGDRWDIVRIDDCWVIQELVFNLELP